MDKLELLIDMKASLGEAPCWDGKKGLFYWVDIPGNKVHIYDPWTKENREIDVGQPVGVVVPRESGSLVVALRDGFFFLDPDNGSLTPIADPEDHIPGNRFNDGKCDPAGRFWAGTMSMTTREPVGALYCMDTNLKVRKVLDGVRVSNGLAWSPDQKTMYFNDTPTRQVAAFDYDINTGDISNKRMVIEFPSGHGSPDGMTIDVEGMLWIAEWGGYKISRWNPNTGKLLEEIPVPVERVTSCTFGGENLDELYITTARRGFADEEMNQPPHAGGVFRIKTGTKGLAAHAFGK